MSRILRIGLVAAMGGVGLWGSMAARAGEPNPPIYGSTQLPSAFPGGGGAPDPYAPVGSPIAVPDTSGQAPGVPSYPGGGMTGTGTGPAGEPGAPTTAAPTDASTAAPFDFGGAGGAAPASGLGGGLGGASGALVMFGDQAPIFGVPRAPLPPNPARPPVPNAPFTGASLNQRAQKALTATPWIRGFKITDNQSPIPQDRVYFTFNYYNNLNYAVNSRIRSPVDAIQVYRYIFGLEKTFLNGNASIGIRDGLNNLSSRSRVPGLGGTSTAFGDLNIYSKFILWQNWDVAVARADAYGRQTVSPGVNGGLISGGLSTTLPTGPGAFAGAPGSVSYRNTALQPFIGYYFRRGDFYLQGFEAINVPLDARDVTLLFHDVAVGYYFLQNPDPSALVSAASATFEVHVNNPLNHRGVFNLSDPVGTADVVDLTYGINVLMSNRALFSTAIVTPVTGPRPFDFEVVGLLNVYFGRTRSAGQRLLTAPIIGG